MYQTKEERAEQLAEMARRLIDEMLAVEKPAGEVMLEDIEQAALRVGQGLQAAIVADGARRAGGEEAVRCPDCGKRMVYQGQRSRAVVSEVGESSIERGYYYCRGCQRGSFPPG